MVTMSSILCKTKREKIFPNLIKFNLLNFMLRMYIQIFNIVIFINHILNSTFDLNVKFHTMKVICKISFQILHFVIKM